jgi:hypothetical protein
MSAAKRKKSDDTVHEDLENIMGKVLIFTHLVQRLLTPLHTGDQTDLKDERGEEKN